MCYAIMFYAGPARLECTSVACISTVACLAQEPEEAYDRISALCKTLFNVSSSEQTSTGYCGQLLLGSTAMTKQQ